MIRKIQEAVQKRKREKVRKEYVSLIEKNPRDTRSRLKLGDIYSKEGKLSEAVEQYAASAEIFFDAGFHLKSIALYKQILKFQPQSISAMRRAAQISYQYGLFAEAYTYYEKMAGIFGKQKGGERIPELFQEIDPLPLKDTRTKIRILEAILPGEDRQFIDPYEQLCELAGELEREDQGLGNALILAKWITEYYPDRQEGYEILLPLLRKAKRVEDLSESLQKVESLYKETDQLEQKRDFLRQFEDDGASFNPDTEVFEGLPSGEGSPGEKVRIRMEANIYDLLKKKAEAKTPGGDESTEEGPQQSALDRLEFQDLFGSFKQGIEDQLSRSDSDTQYNLGIAYQEMELYEDAIEQFKIACENPALHYDAYFMMGSCARSLDRPEEALEYYSKALAVEALEPEQTCAVQYEQAITFRAMGNKSKALEIFRVIKEKQSDYRDVDKQMEELL